LRTSLTARSPKAHERKSSASSQPSLNGNAHARASISAVLLQRLKRRTLEHDAGWELARCSAADLGGDIGRRDTAAVQFNAILLGEVAFLAPVGIEAAISAEVRTRAPKRASVWTVLDAIVLSAVAFLRPIDDAIAAEAAPIALGRASTVGGVVVVFSVVAFLTLWASTYLGCLRT
jgi:hypothetical protein